MNPDPATNDTRFISVGVKLAASMVLIVLLVTAVAAVGLARRERAGLLHSKQDGARMVLKLFALSVGPALEFEDDLAVQEALDRLARDDEVLRAAVWSATSGDEPLASYAARDGASPLLRPPDARISDVALGDTLVVSTPVSGPGDEVMGVASVEYSLEREQLAYAESRRIIITSAGVVSGLMLLLLVGLVRRLVVRPLGGLEAAAAELAQGRSREVPVQANDEVGHLAARFNTMSAAIRDREERLADANEELTGLFDNMRQGILAFGPDLRVEGRHSAACRAVFGRDSLEGVDVRELLLAELDDSTPLHQSLSLWLDMVFDFGPDTWAEALELAPRELALRPGEPDERALALEFRPFFDGARLERLMLLVTDETEQRRLEREARASQSKHEREMAAMRKIVAAGTQSFTAFLRTSTERWRRIESIASRDPNDLDVALLEEMFRHAHTVKGEARTFALGELADAARDVEDTLSRMRKPRSLDREVPKARAAELRANLDAARKALDAARARLVEASPLGEEVLDQVMVAHSDLERVLGESTSAPASLREAIERLAARPLAECAAGLEDAVPTWAASSGKRARLELIGPTQRVPSALAERLRAVLTHLLRNAVAHGIETPEARAAAGKPERGVIEVEARQGPSGTEILVRDDGRGLDLLALSGAAAKSGASIDAERGGAAFAAGVSSAGRVDDLAGHGMGLAAVRRELDEVGYRIEVVNTDGPGVTFRLSPTA